MRYRRLAVLAVLGAWLGGAATSVAATGITAANGQLLLDGQPHYFVGVNAYDATTLWSVNWGCGTQVSDLHALFSSLPPGSLVRTWAFQALGYNKSTRQIDFTAIDRVVQAAAAGGDYLILSLSDQAGTCDDGHWHDQAWYDGGYTKTYDDNGRGLSRTMSYLDWVKAVVARYASNPTVAVYEPVNEPEASNCQPGLSGSSCFGHTTCPAGATQSLRGFFDTIGSTIKGIDPAALVSAGVVGGDQCGVAGSGYATVIGSADVDIATYHDYSSPTSAMPAMLSSRLSDARSSGKAFLVEESGIYASAAGVGCPTLNQRANDFGAKSNAAKRSGADGYLPWNWWPSSSSTCAMTIAPGDPTLTALGHM